MKKILRTVFVCVTVAFVFFGSGNIYAKRNHAEIVRSNNEFAKQMWTKNFKKQVQDDDRKRQENQQYWDRRVEQQRLERVRQDRLRNGY